MDEGGAPEVISAPVVPGVFAALGCRIGSAVRRRIVGSLTVARYIVGLPIEVGVLGIGRDIRPAVPRAVAARVAGVARYVAHRAVTSRVARTGRTSGAPRAASTAPGVGLRIGRRAARATPSPRTIRRSAVVRAAIDPTARSTCACATVLRGPRIDDVEA